MSMSPLNVVCGKRATCSLVDTIDELIDEFGMMDDWDERYQLLLELGDEVPELADDLKTEQNRVEGCLSLVWMVAHVTDDEPPIITIMANSDSHIVRGLIAILLRIYSGRPPQDILDCDIHCLFERLELSKHLSATRRNGLYAMIERIRLLAAQNA